MKHPAMQVKGPGEVEVVDGMISFSESGELITSLIGEMGAICRIIQPNTPSELRGYQSYLIGAIQNDPSSLLVDMPRTSCDVERGVTLEMESPH